MDLSALRDGMVDDDGDGSAVAGLERGCLLPSRANRTAKRGQTGVTEFRYRVEFGSVFAGCLEVGKRYSIGIGERDLGVHC